MRLRTATASDVPLLAAIFQRAFADDEHTQLKVAWRGAEAMQDGMAAALKGWLASPVATLLVAEDDAAQIVGWACWSTIGPEGVRDDPTGKVPDATSPVEELELLTRQDILGCQQEALMAYGTVDVLVSIVVDPKAQGRGVGGRLVDWGVQRADAAGRACWVHASESGARAFARHGFVTQRALEIDLSPFAPWHDPRTWGTVRFCSMIRPPGASSARPRSR